MTRELSPAGELERRFSFHKRAVARRAAGDDSRKIEGLAAVYYDGTEATEYKLWSDYIERIMPGAFDQALARPDDVRGLFNHNVNHLLARNASGTMELSSVDEGLLYRMDVAKTGPGNDVLELLDRGDVNGSSFAFIADERAWREERRGDLDVLIVEILSVQLFDVGPVVYPAYTATTAGKASRDLCTPETLERLEQFRCRCPKKARKPVGLAEARERAAAAWSECSPTAEARRQVQTLEGDLLTREAPRG